MNTVYAQISDWATKELEFWEQATLEKIAQSAELTEEDLKQLLVYFLEDAGLSPKPVARPKLSLPGPSAQSPGQKPCLLVRIFNLNNVNALPPDQEIVFGPQLTVIYGNNGAGKSGYARALGSACFTRGDRTVLPNANSVDLKALPTADIEISTGSSPTVIPWSGGKPCQELRGVYVFDSKSLNAHLAGPNPLSFSPGGLSLLTSLADATDKVRTLTKALADEREKPHNLLPYFEGDSEVRDIVSNLGPGTDLSKLQSLSALSETEEQNLADLEKEIARLRLLDVPKQIARRRQELNDLESLIKSIKLAHGALDDPVVSQAEALVTVLHTRRDDVERLGVSQFASEQFTKIGSPEWLQFLNSAQTLAESEKAGGPAYPTPGDLCLFCRQMLTPEAIDLIRRYWEFLKSDLQSKLDAAEKACNAQIGVLEQVSVGYFAKDSGARRLLEADHPMIIPQLEAQVEACTERRLGIVGALKVREKPAPPPLINVDLSDLETLIAKRNAMIQELQSSDAGQKLLKAESTHRALKHRKLAGQNLKELTSYVEQRKWAVQARQSLGSTHKITAKYNQLFEKLVTSEYKKTFETILGRFSKDLKITIETRGLKGETVRRVALTPATNARKFSADQVLSEGERRAVAIADFLTEATMDTSCGSVVFDDPVTSLDHTWKETLAVCLAELAKSRQVVIFTHDLSFLSALNKHAKKEAISVKSHWIEAREGHPGFVFLENSPVCEDEFKSAQHAREIYAKSKNLPPQEQQSLLQQGFGALRSSYEYLITFEVFEGVVQRFEERLSFGRLKDVVVDRTVTAQIIERMEFLSRYIVAHLHSDTYASLKPSPDLLLEEIGKYETIRDKQKELKKAAKKNSS